MRRFAFVAALALAALATLPASGSAGAPGLARANSSPVVLGLFQVQMSTTSAWTSYTISDGDTVQSKVLNSTGSGTWNVQTSGLSYNWGGYPSPSSGTVDLLYRDIDTQPLTITLIKSGIGVTHVTIKNLTTNQTVAQLDSTEVNDGDSAPPVSQTFTKTQLFGTKSAPLPRDDPRKLVLSFYYPWYANYQDPNLAERPLGRPSTSTQTGVNTMTNQAKDNGIDGFIVSWSGSTLDGAQFRLALKAADAQHQLLTGVLESAIAAKGNAAANESTEVAWLRQLLAFRNNSAFLKTPSGVPVVFVYAMSTFTAAQWQDIENQLAADGLTVDLVGDSFDPSYEPLEWGQFEYGATASYPDLRTFALDTSLSMKGAATLNPSAPTKLLALPVSPGYDDQKLRGSANPIVSRAGGQRYEQTWAAALSGQPDWILVTSWNEWYEDTAIEPGGVSGSQALALTRAESAAWKRN